MPTDLQLKQITKEAYQESAVQFAKNVAGLAPTASIEKFIKLLPPKAKIIDIGCGSGRDAKIFASHNIDVLGIDFSSNLISIAKSQAPAAKFEVMDIEAMVFDAGTFDGAWAACSLVHVAKSALPDVLKRIHAILKPNGFLYLTFKKGLGEILENDKRYDGDVKKYWAYYEEQELKSYIHNAQFKLLEFTVMERTDPYQTHDAFRIFCQKG